LITNNFWLGTIMFSEENMIVYVPDSKSTGKTKELNPFVKSTLDSITVLPILLINLMMLLEDDAFTSK
jgi:hypothetical protein